MHLPLHPVRDQPKGNVKLTVDYSFVFHCTVFRDFVPKVAISIMRRTSSGSYLPFDDPEFAKAFDQRIHTQYTNALSDMISFAKMFINRSRKGNWLVAALLV